MLCSNRFLAGLDVILIYSVGGFTADFDAAFSSRTEEQQSTGTGTGPGKCGVLVCKATVDSVYTEAIYCKHFNRQ